MGVESIGRAAFDVIYEDNVDAVFRTALRYAGNHHTAEEITQNVFVKLYTYMEHINLEAAKSWLLVTARNMALNSNRVHNHEVLIEEMQESGYPICAYISPEDEFLRKLRERECKALADCIFQNLYQVNERWYEAVTLTYCLGKPQKDVAECMGISLEILHSMLYRAKKWVRKNYEEKYDHLNKA